MGRAIGAGPWAGPCRGIKGHKAPWTGGPMGLPMGRPMGRPMYRPIGRPMARSMGLYAPTFGGQDLHRKHNHLKSDAPTLTYS